MTADIPLLAQAFLREFARVNNKSVSNFTADALELLLRYRWPGNVRELRTAIEHAAVPHPGWQVARRGCGGDGLPSAGPQRPDAERCRETTHHPGLERYQRKPHTRR